MKKRFQSESTRVKNRGRSRRVSTDPSLSGDITAYSKQEEQKRHRTRTRTPPIIERPPS